MVARHWEWQEEVDSIMEKSEFGGGQCKFLCLDCGDGYMILVFLSKSIGPYIHQE